MLDELSFRLMPFYRYANQRPLTVAFLVLAALAPLVWALTAVPAAFIEMGVF